MRSLSFLLVVSVFQLAAFAQTTPQHEIPFQLLPSGHILVKVKVDNVEGSFIFDTGAGLTVFTKTFFDKQRHTKKLDGRFTGFRATGERIDAELFTVRNIELGSLKKATEEISYLDFNLGGIDGILSLKLLETRPFTIDFEKKVIRLENTTAIGAIAKTAHVIPLQLEQHRDKALDIFAYFRINDTLTLQLSLDSGAGAEVFRLNAAYLKRLGIDVNDTANVKKQGKRSEIDTAFVSYIYTTTLKKIAALSAPAVHTTNFKAQFVEGLIYDGIIWINWLGSRITIDLPGRRLLVRR